MSASLPDGLGGAQPPAGGWWLACRVVTAEWPAAVRAGIEADLRRVAGRLRTLSPAQLAAAVEGHPSRAAGGRAVAQLLVVAAQGIEERSAPDEPRWRQLPELSPFAVGDQVAVTGHDLLALLGSVGPQQPVWTPGTRRTAVEVLTDAADHLASLRRVI